MAAKKEPKKKTEAGHDYAKIAKKGELEPLRALASDGNDAAAARLAYKWLTVAVDFGHEDAEDEAEEMLDAKAIGGDDDGAHAGAAHWELAAAYLAGDEGLPAKLELAQRHLRAAFDRHDLAGINRVLGTSYDASGLLARLSGKAKDLLAFELAGGDPARAVTERLALVEKLVSIKAPAAMLAGQKKLLAKESDSYFRKNPPGSSPEVDALRERVNTLLRA